MHFPTVKENQTNIIHIIKKHYSSECGYTFTIFNFSSKTDTKKIIFRSLDEVTCKRCQEIFKEIHLMD
ncbi:hypothetical protein [Metabacillus fastidiosus]|uniref:hypothetical protein n=1 Tax=Metabacillus fastidiosus TaxID=1458 RepID=UPI003D2E8C48